MVSKRMLGLGTARSVIRELFEYGNQRAAVVGRENVYDFSLGNPSVPAPDAVNEAAIRILREQPELIHCYTSAQGDAAARRALDRYLDGLSVGLINLANILFPEVICLGGGISAADDDLLLDPLRERFHQGCFNKDNPPQLVKASLGNDAGVVGAALLCDMV